MADLMTQPLVSSKAMSAAAGPTGGFVTAKAVTQVEADYSANASDPSHRCALCRHFLAPDGCQVVEGPISPEGWCKFFEAGDHVDDAMIAFMVEPHLAAHLQALATAAGLQDLLPADEMHLTLAYLGKIDDLVRTEASDEENVAGILSTFVKDAAPICGSVNGVFRFVDGANKDCICVGFDSPDLPAFHLALKAWLDRNGIPYKTDHGFTPHITLAYIDKNLPTPTVPLQPVDVTFDTVTLMWGEQPYDIPLSKKGGKKRMLFKIVKHDSKYHVLDLSTGQRLPEDGFDSRDEAIKHQHLLSGKTSPDGDDDSELIQVGHTVFWKEVPTDLESTLLTGVVSAIEGDIATITQADGSAVQVKLSDLEPTPEDDHPEEVKAEKSNDDEDQHYAFPEEKKLPMPDAGHVILAAAALGPNPPHGHRASIPEDKLGSVKEHIRARARELGLGKEEMAKVNAYLSGKMPGDLDEKDADLWTKAYDDAFKETGDELKAALAAQGAINRYAIVGTKSVDGLPTKIGGWMMLFSDPDNLDLQDTYFNQATKTLAEYYPSAPLWYEHGKDPKYGAMPIGHRTALEVYPRGIWGEHELHTDHPLYPRTAKEIARGVHAYSSDSLPGYVQHGYDPSDGYLGIWPLAGCSVTRQPAEPGLGHVIAAKSLDAVLDFVKAQKREATGSQEETDQLPSGEKAMDENETTTQDEDVETEKDAPIEGVNEMNDDFDGDEKAGSTLDALAKMYGCESSPEAVRGALDSHIERMKSGGPHPELLKALGMPEDTKADDVANHLNNLYSAAMSTGKDDVPTATMSAEPDGLNYNVLHRHLHSGGQKSVGPYMTGEIGAKGINVLTGITKTPMVGVYADLKRIARFEKPRFVLGQKAMSSASGPNGGYILHQEIAPTVLDPLRAKVICFQLGAEKIDMQGTNVLTVPVMNTAPDANWVGENQASGDDQPAYRTVTLYPHGLSSLVKVPFNVEANMTPQAEQQLRTQMSRSIGLKIDKACLIGTGGALVSGGGMEIFGISNTPGVQTYDMNGNGRTPSFIDVGQAFGLLDDANVPYDESSRRGIAFHSKIQRAFTLATDSLGNPLLRPAWRAASEREIMAMPYGVSTQIPTNLTYGSATNASQLFGGDWQYMYIGLSDQVEVRLDQTFAGNLQAGLLIYVYADVKIVYPQAFFIMKGVLPVSVGGVTTGSNSVN